MRSLPRAQKANYLLLALGTCEHFLLVPGPGDTGKCCPPPPQGLTVHLLENLKCEGLITCCGKPVQNKNCNSSSCTEVSAKVCVLLSPSHVVRPNWYERSPFSIVCSSLSEVQHRGLSQRTTYLSVPFAEFQPCLQ